MGDMSREERRIAMMNGMKELAAEHIVEQSSHEQAMLAAEEASRQLDKRIARTEQWRPGGM
jgi:hypothetical protein